VESRPDKRPLLSDLRESGSIEQDADVVMFLYREDYYNKDEQNNIMEILVRKHRNGPTGDAKVLARLQYSRFENLDTQRIQ
jgi:replicative DNA helicase